MEIRYGIVILQEAEVSQECPSSPAWGASQLAAYGPEIIAKSEKLKQLLYCTEVLKLAGVDFVIEAEGDSPLVDGQAAATELVQSEAPGMGNVSEESAL